MKELNRLVRLLSCHPVFVLALIVLASPFANGACS
jgi:hypothetical protein